MQFTVSYLRLLSDLSHFASTYHFLTIPWEIWSSHNGAAEDSSLLGCKAVLFGTTCMNLFKTAALHSLKILTLSWNSKLCHFSHAKFWKIFYLQQYSWIQFCKSNSWRVSWKSQAEMSVLPSHSFLLLITTMKKIGTFCFKLQDYYNLSV